MALSALSAGVITPNTTFFGAPTWTLPGTQRRYRDWLKTGHGMLNVTKAIEESADTFSIRSPSRWASTGSMSG